MVKSPHHVLFPIAVYRLRHGITTNLNIPQPPAHNIIHIHNNVLWD